ncbi:MAG: MFS transporter [Rhizobiaceae bacterium]|nr:MFS transporter [Rhizobiaceae bacterium]
MIDRLATLSPFQHVIFRSIWIATLLSNFGALIHTVAAAWLMTRISTSADMVALVQASAALPIMLFSAVSGAIADNFNRRKIMLAAQVFMLLTSVSLTLAVYAEAMSPWLLLVFTFLMGCGTALHNPSWQASVGDMVPRSELPAAVALNATGNNLARSVGPAFGGAIVATAGVAPAFLINATSYLALIFVLCRWKPAITSQSLPPEALGPAIVAGFRYVAMSPNIQKVLLRTFIFGLTAVSLLALLPLVARDTLSGDAFLYGFLLGAFGAGAVSGGLISGILRRKLTGEWIVRLSFAGCGVCAAAIGLSSFPWLTGTALLIGGACWVVTFSLCNISIQLWTPRWVVGRALSLFHMAAFGGMAAGSWVWGIVADWYGLETALQLAALTMALGATIGLGRLALPDQMQLNLDPLNSWREPHVGFDLRPRSGPIKIMIEYIIAAKDTPEFLNLMAERRRIRRRDGARRWNLIRDLEHPDHWIESYQVSTWIEYVRYTQRITHADAVIVEQIRRLHSGKEAPTVRRLIERTQRRHASAVRPSG